MPQVSYLDKFPRNLAQPRVTLTDDEEDALLTSWLDGQKSPAMLAAMTNEHSDTDMAAETGEHTIDVYAADESIPTMASDWAPEVDEYRISSA